MAAPQPFGGYGYPPNAPPASVEKPTAAAVLSIIGGVFIFLGGLLALAISAFIHSISFGAVGGGLEALSAVGVLVGILTIVFGILLLTMPRMHVVLGALIIVFSIISLGTAIFGGFFIGFILALIGGILAVTFHPAPAPMPYAPMYIGAPGPVAPPPPPGILCRRCGGSVPAGTRFCPHCGSPVA